MRTYLRNIFMGIFEENYIYHLIKEKCNLYLRYMHDIFLIWTRTLDEFNKFIAEINEVHPSIKFDFNYWSNSVNVLDTTVKKSFTGELSTTLFKKETDFQAYLHKESEHPESLKHSIPYVQALHLKRICIKAPDFKANCDILSKKLIERGYKKAEIYNTISKTYDRNRELSTVTSWQCKYYSVFLIGVPSRIF